MFADIRALESLRVGMPMLIFHAEPYVQCMSADGATPDSFLDCKSSWCSSHAWENHESVDFCFSHPHIDNADRPAPGEGRPPYGAGS